MYCIFKNLMLLSTILILFGCPTKPIESSDINIQDLLKSWLHSYEEERDGSKQIYRPHDYYAEFPASWFRMQYTFNKDSTCSWLVLAANDVHFPENGTWELNTENDMEVLIYDSAGTLKENLSFKIFDLQSDLLRITSID